MKKLVLLICLIVCGCTLRIQHPPCICSSGAGSVTVSSEMPSQTKVSPSISAEVKDNTATAPINP